MDDLEDLRRRGVRALAAIGWLCTAIALGRALAGGGYLPALLAVALSVLPTLFAISGRCDAQVRLVLGLTIPLYPALFLAQWSGSDWILDQHMVFFAVIATLAMLADWRPILVAAAVTAVHHLATNFLAPTLVFPDGPDFTRVVMHAVIVVVESGALMFLSSQLETQVVRQASARSTAEEFAQASAREREQVAAEQKAVIDALEARLAALAQGDLAMRIEQAFPAAYEPLRMTLNAATSDLSRLVRSVSDSALQITNGSAEIRNASDDLSRRTEQQASAVEHSGSATHKLTQEIESTASRAGEVNVSISTAQADAYNGGQVVERAIDAMNAIEQSAGEISQIITLIDGIAFQTNLLALNAGVEAARAGDAGKGFAVVANEVRALAQRTADAAQTIKSLISVSSEQVSQGVALVGETGTVLRTIVEQITGIGSAIGDIASAAEAQARDLHSVGRSFGDLDRVTQQNAAMVEESNAAAHSLAREAESLKALVARFRTEAANAGFTLRHAA
ncbi:methyl-accepting chemotaxis protein [Novosphingobium olei]|uniref:Methyl-accepting chemotaxis protein n=1 Tax=Novosphingobium olei TaxID=2728851 RepID=A0A7Y0GA31_9SPHN|nr:methyl-accepting chemotaxis protein [Novosphingobium olei]NML93459.1 methyl-accepting chemotaxis protein [Novosphingobium olei]